MSRCTHRPSSALISPITLMPAGLAFLQAQQAGADSASAAGQALTGILLGGHVDPLQSGNSRTAAAGLIVKSMLQVLNSQR